MKNYSSQNHKA